MVVGAAMTPVQRFLFFLDIPVSLGHHVVDFRYKKPICHPRWFLASYEPVPVEVRKCHRTSKSLPLSRN
jgi:hypothetical protein